MIHRVIKDLYYCAECKTLGVEKDHSCEQWANVYKIHREAIEQIIGLYKSCKDG